MKIYLRPISMQVEILSIMSLTTELKPRGIHRKVKELGHRFLAYYTIHANLGRMVEKGWINKRPSGVGGGCWYRATTNGMKALREHRP